MTHVRILPEILSNKIAAGEVVERPASVVKELVENAIDAGSERISIDIEQGGRAMIRVSDIGRGMGHDDALLAIERYATSKIASESDLFNIKSLGFRGEALPSIAAVSRFTMVTRDETSEAATEIRVEGGKIKSVNPVGAPRGTMITVRQLFFNTPARRKFMKTTATEFGHIADTVACIALSRPEIRFRLTHNGKTVREWHDVRNPEVRMADVMGENLAHLLYPVSSDTPAVSLAGWVCDPSITRSTSGKIYIFVNGRFIRDRGVQHAVAEGYRGRLMKGRFPLAVLYMSVPSDDVDVNVHPTKHEVRFSRHREIYSAVNEAISQALGEKTGKTYFNAPGETPAEPGRHVRDSKTLFGKENTTENRDFLRTNTPARTNAPEDKSPEEKTPEEKTPENKPMENKPMADKPRPGPDRTAPPPQQTALFTRENLRLAAVIGQFNNTYILCEKAAELLLIDQHAAHERIIYEYIRSKTAHSPSIPVQKLLVPETIELGYRESAAVTALLPELNRTGLEIDHFGANTFIITAVPEILAEKPMQPLIVEIAEMADACGYQNRVDHAIDACRILMACHGAVRANQPLTQKQMEAIIEQLHSCENPYSCPHGRPTMITWDANVLEKRFKRTS